MRIFFTKSKITFIYISCLIIVIFSCKEPPTDAPLIQTKITGTVVNKSNQNLMPGVEVFTSPSTTIVITNNNGQFELAVTAGSYEVIAKNEGFKEYRTNITIVEGETKIVNIQIEELLPELEVSPLNIDFGSTNTSANLSISNKTGIGSISFTLTNNSNWLTLSEYQGTVTNTPKIISLEVDRSKAGFGSFTDIVKVTSDNDEKNVNVLMKNVDPNAPWLEVSVNTLDFDSTQTTKNFLISNIGGGTLNWSIITNRNWISCNPISGTDNSNVDVSIDRSGLSAGSYNGTISVSSDGGSKNISVNMIVTNTPPATGSWQIMTTIAALSSGTPNSISIINENDIWVVGSEVWHYNGSWQKATINNVDQLLAVNFINSSTGFAVGKSKQLFKYSSGSWQRLPNLSTPYTDPNLLYDVMMLSTNQVMVSDEYGDVHTSNDGGQNWTNYSLRSLFENSAEIKLWDLDMSSSSNVWVLGIRLSEGVVCQFDGLSWTKMTSPSFSSSSSTALSAQLSVISTADIRLCSNRNSIFNPGGVWKYNVSNWQGELNIDINTIHMINSSSGWAGSSKLYFYNGSSWVEKSGTLTSKVVCIKMLNDSFGIALLQDGTILKYSN